DLEKGVYDVQVELKDDVGNRSQLSVAYQFTIDTDGIAPTIELKNSTAFNDEPNKNITKDNIFQFKGKAAQGARISLRRHDEDNDTAPSVIQDDISAN
ncbi:hypothetical protein, partial [Candidatus Hamiltonella defensa]